jgi:hypothetical protein
MNGLGVPIAAPDACAASVKRGCMAIKAIATDVAFMVRFQAGKQFSWVAKQRSILGIQHGQCADYMRATRSVPWYS